MACDVALYLLLHTHTHGVKTKQETTTALRIDSAFTFLYTTAFQSVVVQHSQSFISFRSRVDIAFYQNV